MMVFELYTLIEQGHLGFLSCKCAMQCKYFAYYDSKNVIVFSYQKISGLRQVRHQPHLRYALLFLRFLFSLKRHHSDHILNVRSSRHFLTSADHGRDFGLTQNQR